MIGRIKVVDCAHARGIPSDRLVEFANQSGWSDHNDSICIVDVDAFMLAFKYAIGEDAYHDLIKNGIQGRMVSRMHRS